ncbi:hypothetical protein HDU80_005577, partial [Chytriomyces hyalinus]
MLGPLTLTKSFASMLDLLHDTSLPAIRAVDGRAVLTHRQLKALVETLPVKELGISPSSRVGILLPEGPELGSCVLAMMALCCVVPINYHLTDTEVVLELDTLGATAVILCKSKADASIIP